jgi:carbon storage regulator
MLILSRKLDEGITIGDDVVIKVLEINKGSIKLGIDAPRTTQILRNELKEAVESANTSATTGVDASVLQGLSKKLKK